MLITIIISKVSFNSFLYNPISFFDFLVLPFINSISDTTYSQNRKCQQRYNQLYDEIIDHLYLPKVNISHVYVTLDAFDYPF